MAGSGVRVWEQECTSVCRAGAWLERCCSLQVPWMLSASNSPPPPTLQEQPWTVNAPWTVNSCLPLMAAAGKCNLGFSFQALRCLKLIMSFKGGGREQSRSHQSEDFEVRVTGGAYLWPRGNWDGCHSSPPLSTCGEDWKWQELTREWVRLQVKCCV